MLFLLFYESLSNGWILESGKYYSYNIRHKDFDIILGNYNLNFYLRVDGTEKRVGITGNDTNGDIGVTTTSKLFDNSEYMQVIHNVTNRGQSSHEISLGFSLDLDLDSSDGSNGDGCGHQNIPPFKGVYSFHKERNVTFLLRDTAFVTDVDTYSYKGRPGSGRWTNSTDYENVSDGSGDWIYFSWQNRTILSGESKQFSYVVGIGDYTKYRLNLLNELPKYYLPTAKLDFSIDSIENGQKIFIEREFNGKKNSWNLTDSGSLLTFSDELDLPLSLGEYTAHYKISNDKYGQKEYEYKIKVGIKPQISIIDKKDNSKFYPNAKLNVSLEVKCDTACSVSILNDDSILDNFDVTSNGVAQSILRLITIPENPPYSKHKISVFAADEVYRSLDDAFQYTILPNPGVIELQREPPVSFISNKNMSLYGTVRSVDINTRICLYIQIENNEKIPHECIDCSTTELQPFKIYANFTTIKSETIYEYYIFGIDDRNVETNNITRRIMIFIPKDPKTCRYVRVSIGKYIFSLFTCS